MENYDSCFRMGMELFDELQEGKLHLFCPICLTHKSNMTKIEGIDPNASVLLIEKCPVCYNNDKEYNAYYFDSDGILISEIHK